MSEDLFLLIRQKDDIAIFSKDETLINSMKTSLHTAECFVNATPDKKIDLFLFDIDINISETEILNLILKYKTYDTKIILHSSYEILKTLLEKENFLFEIRKDEFLVYIADFVNFFDKREFKHKEFEKFYEALGSNLCSFSRDYHNPFIYRNLIQIGTKISNDELLTKLCNSVVKIYPETSPDVGGALCTLGYKKYISDEKDDELFKKIENYIKTNLNTPNPHTSRWIMSLYYLLGIYYRDVAENIPKAIDFLEKCYDFDYKKFNPLICTKQVSACGILGYMALEEENNIEKAREWFKKGIELAKRSILDNPDQTLGKDDFYIPFGFTETAELCDIASQCVFGFNNAEVFITNRAAFDNKFSKKRFGLITYCQKLENQLQKEKKL